MRSCDVLSQMDAYTLKCFELPIKLQIAQRITSKADEENNMEENNNENII